MHLDSFSALRYIGMIFYPYFFPTTYIGINNPPRSRNRKTYSPMNCHGSGMIMFIAAFIIGYSATVTHDQMRPTSTRYGQLELLYYFSIKESKKLQRCDILYLGDEKWLPDTNSVKKKSKSLRRHAKAIRISEQKQG